MSEMAERYDTLAEDIALVAKATDVMQDMNADMYRNLARFVCDSHNIIAHKSGKDAREYVEGVLASVEAIIKTKYNVTSLPTAYRTAKSVLLGAVQEGLSILDTHGNVRGKSELENVIRYTRESALLRGVVAIPDGPTEKKSYSRVIHRLTQARDEAQKEGLNTEVDAIDAIINVIRSKSGVTFEVRMRR